MTKSDIFIEKLRERLSIVDIIGKKVNWDFKRSNVRSGTYWACCPFHTEKTASFKVDENKGLYYCFGCHEKGDAITFVMKNENLDFLKSIEKLAGEVGLILPSTFGKKPQISRSKSFNSILDVNKLASSYFADCLKSTPTNSATLFFKNRISSSEISNIFELGFAPNKNKGLFNYLIKKGYREDIIISSGLCSKNNNGEIYDRFRDRIIFPIHNSSYEIVGFGGRALSASANAKYLNSPETEVFQKGKLLFNEKNCKKNLNGNDVIIVEGYMDVIALYKVGIKNCVAPLGTAVTLDQLNRIWRISKSPIFAFDGDIGPGLPLWLPNGTVMIEELEVLAKDTEKKAGYSQVRTPHLTKGTIYEKNPMPFLREMFMKISLSTRQKIYHWHKVLLQEQVDQHFQTYCIENEFI